ncbi:MurR/RpiR family transcriptional regulator [Paracoccus onubensis]|uniref:MurR/RpiR family transcriptional regulator n=1 Tax=Paracoccus onubensis TaxID=1675788 RepID=UPI0027314BCA|nr:MurR/RpiR family transcriptional regulator [Paracoccus onubensis]MDP0926226.1 MurR/RpiR family transcriptional regulator [Paracoccus onubensis]
MEKSPHSTQNIFPPQGAAAKGALGRATLAAIHAKISAMPAAQERVARIFVERPEEAIRLSVADLAHEAKSGEASVIRFCRTMGFHSLRDLRVALAADIVYRNTAAPRRPVDHVDRLCSALQATAQNVDPDALRRVALAMKAAPHIDIFGSGISGMGAHLFAYRFSRIGLIARAWNDDVVADEILASRKRGSVAMIVSETGLTLRTARFLEHSREAGAFTVAICGQGTEALAPLCDAILTVTPLDPLPERGEMAPLIGKLFLCDRLAGELIALEQEKPAGHKKRKRQSLSR